MGLSSTSALGVDVGGVLVDTTGDSDTSFFGSRPLDTPVMPGALEVLALLVPAFEGRVHVVSKAGPRVESLTRRWLDHIAFFTATGIAPANLHFVRERRDKAGVCARQGIDHFVDDRVDVLEAMPEVAHRYLFAPAAVAAPRGLTLVSAWQDLRHLAAVPAAERRRRRRTQLGTG